MADKKWQTHYSKSRQSRKKPSIPDFIEIVDIDVEGVTKTQIQEYGWQEDQLVAKRLATRKVGQTPQMEHKH